MFEYKKQYQYPINFCLNLTDSCNLACVYCFVQQKPHFITLDIAKDAINYIINNLNKRKELGTIDQEEKACVTFFGGEPTLLWDQIIVPIVQYVETTYPNQIDFTITTNGTLLNKDRIDFLKEHNIYPLLSIDGNKEVQNYNRPQRNGEGSFDLVYKNIPYLLENFPMTTFRGTINQQMVSHLYESYKFAYTNGFHTIFLCPNARENWTKENLKILHQEVFKIYTDRIIHYLNNIKPINFTLIDKSFEKILENDIQVYTSNYWQRSFSRNVMRCGLGTGSASIAYDGKIFGCQEQDSRDTNAPFYIGDIYNGINPKKHTILLEKYNYQQETKCENETLCKNCILKNVCVEETCPSVSLDKYQNFFIRPEVDCIYNQALMEGASRSMDYLVNYEHNQLFKEYLDNLYINYEKEEK